MVAVWAYIALGAVSVSGVLVVWSMALHARNGRREIRRRSSAVIFSSGETTDRAALPASSGVLTLFVLSVVFALVFLVAAGGVVVTAIVEAVA